MPTILSNRHTNGENLTSANGLHNSSRAAHADSQWEFMGMNLPTKAVDEADISTKKKVKVNVPSRIAKQA